MNISDKIVEILDNNNIERCFMVTGGGSMHLNEAFRKSSNIKILPMHHEQACAMAADSYARLNHKPAVVNVTTGPGVINSLNGVFGAFTDSLPMVIISGQVKSETYSKFSIPEIRQLGDQEVKTEDLVKPIVKKVITLKDGENINSLEGKPSPDGKGTIQIKKGIEVGHIFQLGKVYSDAMKANVLDNDGKAKSLFMGCYGIGVSRLVAAAIEQNNDEKGIIWPESMAPFEVNIVAIGFDKDEKIAKAATDLYKELSSMGYEVILDDRKDGYGTKMKDAELIGIPINIIIGKQFVQNNEIELKHRDGQSSIGKVEDITTIFEHYKNS